MDVPPNLQRFAGGFGVAKIGDEYFYLLGLRESRVPFGVHHGSGNL